MKRLCSWLLAGLAASASPWAAALPPADIYLKLAPSVWRVHTFDEDGLPIAFGSAVVVAPGTLVTNCHVLARASKVSVRHEKERLDAKLVMWDPARDVCEVKADGLAAPAVAIGDDSTLRVGQPVYALGAPAGLELTMSEGLLSSIRRNDKAQIVLLQTSASISGGSSGGGLFDDQGRLIGLTTLAASGARPNQIQSLNFAVPVEWVRQLPDRFARLTAPAGSASGATAGAALPVAQAGSAASATPSAPAVDPGDAEMTHANPPAPNAVEGGRRPSVRQIVAVADDAHLPFTSEKMREAYRQFLGHPAPRAFAIGENGSWYANWRTTATVPAGGLVDIGQRAMLNCQQHSVTRCHLYAVDDQVVYDGPSPGR